jgi:hypothetical protein
MPHQVTPNVSAVFVGTGKNIDSAGTVQPGVIYLIEFSADDGSVAGQEKVVVVNIQGSSSDVSNKIKGQLANSLSAKHPEVWPQGTLRPSMIVLL